MQFKDGVGTSCYITLCRAGWSNNGHFSGATNCWIGWIGADSGH